MSNKQIQKLKNVNKSKIVFDQALEIETSQIIESVSANWKKFLREDLLNFCSQIDSILQKNKQYGYIVRIGDYDYEKTLARLENQRRDQNDNKNCPLPQIVSAATRESDSITIVPAETKIILTPEDEEFTLFFAYKLSLLKSELVSKCLTYLSNKYYQRNISKFLSTMKFVLSDYDSVIGKRKEIIEEITTNLKKPQNRTRKARQESADFHMKLSPNVENKFDHLGASFEHLTLRNRVIFLDQLILLGQNEDEVASKLTRCKNLYMLLNMRFPKDMRGSSIYKYLSDYFTRRDPKNIENFKILRNLAESLKRTDLVKALDKQMKP